jgi:hypothetical protein
MPIDFVVEPAIPLTQAAAHVPRRRRGRKTSVSTLYRWASRGVRGVVLETLQIGGSRCTSLPALKRFFDRLSKTANDMSTESKVAVDRQAQIEQAERELDVRWAKSGSSV